MKRLNFKIKHKFVLLILILMMLVSASMIVTTMRLSNDGKKKVLKGVAEKLEHLQQSSIAEFNNFTNTIGNLVYFTCTFTKLSHNL